MIPSLLPFMILSGIMVRMHLTESFAAIAHPFLFPLFRMNKNMTYVIIIGFLCGFPMGAKVTCDLLDRNMIQKKEAEYLLAFCNNIGPVYFVSYVIPLLHRKLLLPYLFGMYGLPLLYGFILRHTVFRNLSCKNTLIHKQDPDDKISRQIDDAVSSSVQSILMLGGYMILFNLLNLIPYTMSIINTKLSLLPELIAPILEITGGLGILGSQLPLVSLLLLPFGGLSCIAQTYSIIRHTNISICSYILHKLILTVITIVYYFLWYQFSPDTFLR